MASPQYEKHLDPTDYKHEPANVGVSVEAGDFANEYDEDVPEVGLKRELKSRHIAMISIGGVIGTGLFLGTAGALAHGGPLGLLLGYSVVG